MGRKRIVEVDAAPTGKRIRTMAEPSGRDFAHAAIVTAYAARESLSIVERTCDTSPSNAPGWIDRSDELLEDAAGMLRSVLALLHMTPEGWGEKTKVAVDHVQRAIHSTAASLGHLGIYRSYRDGPTEREQVQRDHYHSVLKRATRASRQEAHRGLAELLEAFPHAYEQTEE